MERRFATNRSVVLSVLALAALMCVPAKISFAVSVVTHTFATDTNDPWMPGCPVYDLKAQYVTDPISVTSSIQSNTTRAHAQSWATAKVTGSGLTKSASGTGWVDPGVPSYDLKGFSWSAEAAGTQLLVNGPGTTAQFVFSIPQASTLTLDSTGYPANFNDTRYHPPALQTFARDPLPPGLTASQLSLYDVSIGVTATFHQPGMPDFTFINGGYTINAAGDRIPFGQAPPVQFVTGGQNSLNATFQPTQSPPITVLTNIPFTVSMDFTMKMGSGSASTGADFPENIPLAIGGGASFTMNFNLAPGQPGFNVTGLYPGISLGDLNRDGIMNNSDIDWMTAALADPQKFRTGNNLTTTDFLTEADFNHDGQVTNADIQAYLNMLHGGGSNTVPEPSAIALALLGIGGIAMMRKGRSA
jgi:PEP-CTERM motif